MASLSEMEAEVKGCIGDMFLDEAELETLRPDSDLLDVLDSLQILRLVITLETMYGVKFHDSDMTVDNLQSVAKLADFVRRRLAVASQALEPASA